MPENQPPTESIESIESDSRAQDLLLRIDSFLARDEDALLNMETEKVAEFLRGVLETFGKLDTACRRKVFLAMQKIVMHNGLHRVHDVRATTISDISAGTIGAPRMSVAKEPEALSNDMNDPVPATRDVRASLLSEPETQETVTVVLGAE